RRARLPLHLLLEQRGRRRQARARHPEIASVLRRDARARAGPCGRPNTGPLPRPRRRRERQAMRALAFALILAAAPAALAADERVAAPFIWTDLTGKRDMPWLGSGGHARWYKRD